MEEMTKIVKKNKQWIHTEQTNVLIHLHAFRFNTTSITRTSISTSNSAVVSHSPDAKNSAVTADPASPSRKILMKTPIATACSVVYTSTARRVVVKRR